jgi:PadR family transcriptional regulator, regulatory protein AphA
MLPNTYVIEGIKMIQYAILGLLSWQPFTGYDLKRIISDSDIFYWSGNNNQIYRTLIQLHDSELVSQQVEYQESLPARKVYTITDKGREELRRWVLSTPELPELHNTFLIQLAWADQLSDDQLDTLLQTYEAEVAVQLRMQEEKARRKSVMPERTAREVFLWARISENILASYQNELNWVRAVRRDLEKRLEK